MTVRRCRFCGTHIEKMLTRSGDRMYFDYHPVDVADDPEHEGWIPGRWIVFGKVQMAMAPVTYCGRGRQEAVRRVVMLHHCEEYRVWKAANMASPGARG